jgi:PAS domain S-box-containing protein
VDQGWWQTFVGRATLLFGSVLALVVLAVALAMYVAVRGPLLKSIHDNIVDIGHARNDLFAEMVDAHQLAIKMIASRGHMMRLTRDFLRKQLPRDQYLEQCRSILGPTVAGNPEMREVWICDLKGNVIFTTGDERLGQTQADSEEFASGVQEAYVSPIQLVGDIRTVVLAAPLYLDGEPIGVVMADWNVDSVMKKSTNNAVLGSTCEVVLGRLNEASLELMSSTRSPRAIHDFALPLNSPLRADLSGNAVSKWTDWDGRATLAVLQNVGYRDWVTLTKFDQSEAYKPLDGLWRTLVFAIPATFLSGLGLVHLVSRKIARPIAKLTETAGALRAGDLSARVTPEGFSEVVQLARVFNGMADQMKTVNTRLEDRVRDRTEQLTSSQAALSQQNQVLESILSSIADGIVVSDVEGKWLFMNRAARGGNEEPAVLSSYADWSRVYGLYLPDQKTLVPTEQLPPVRAIRGELVRDVSVFVKNERSPDGFWLVTSSSPIRNAQGEITGAVSVFRDVTQQLRDEALLHRHEQRLDGLAQNTQSVIYIKDLEGRYEMVNQRFSELFKVSPEAVVGRTDPEIFGSESAKVYTENDRLVAATGECHNFEEVAMHQDGPHTYVSVKFPLRNLQGEIEAVGGISTDITQRKMMEKALQESNERYALVFRASTDGIFDWNVRTGEAHFSPRWKSMIGFDSVELDNVFETWRERLHPDDKDWVLDTLARYLRNEVPTYDIEYRMRHKDGRYRWILARGVALRDEVTGKPYRMVGSHADTTARKEVEQSLKRMTEELARSNADLEQFAHVASHDLQEPLRMVASYVELLERRYKDKLDTPANEYIQFAVEGVHRMQTLIQDLLELCRLGSAGGKREEVDLNLAVERAMSNLQVAVQEAHAEMVVGQLPIIVGDPTRLTQLFQNLISNAIRFRSERPPRIEISAEIRDDLCLCRVKDNGIGFEQQYAEKIFTAFQRLHPSSVYPGSGVGLAICKRVVELHGGTIAAQSSPGNGASFLVTLPVGKSSS